MAAKMKTKKKVSKAKPVKLSKGKAPAKSVKKLAKVATKPQPKVKKVVSRAKAPAPTAAKAMTSIAKARAFLKPLIDRLLVQPEGASERTAGGLYIPGHASERQNRGEVLARGPGQRNKKGEIRPLDVTVGDRVLYPEFAGDKITVDGIDFLILREQDVLGVVS